MQYVTLTIDGTVVKVRAGTSLIAAAKKAGVEIPTLCFLPGRPARGVCRVCSVWVANRRGLIPACSTPVAEGMEVETQLPIVLQARRMMLELALAEHGPCDENVCGGDQKCQLVHLARHHGVKDQRFDPIEKLTRTDLSSDCIQVRPQGCILCDRCVQACRDLHIIGRAGRGSNTHIVFDADLSMEKSDCIACGDCVAVCPVDVFH